MKLLQEGKGIGAKELEEGLKTATTQEAADNFITKFLESNGLADKLGEWVVEPIGKREPPAIAYEEQITGRVGEAYLVKGVKFDGYARGVLMEAKGPGYAKKFLNADGTWKDFFLNSEKGGVLGILSQAKRQVAAANGIKISWHVAESEFATALRTLFQDNNIIGINVLVTPPIK